MDTSVKPGDDFFGYVEGHWLKTVRSSPTNPGAGYNYDLPDATEVEVRKLVEDAAPIRPIRSLRKVSDFYAALIDAAGHRIAGNSHPAALSRPDREVRDKDQLVLLMTEPAYAAPIGIGIAADAKDPTHYTVSAARRGWACRRAIITC